MRPRHLVLLPDTIACAIFLMASAVHMVTTGCTLLITRLAFEDDTWPALAFGSAVTSSIGNGETVAFVWATLAPTGRWTPVPDWVDRAGRAPGVVMIVAASAFEVIPRREADDAGPVQARSRVASPDRLGYFASPSNATPPWSEHGCAHAKRHSTPSSSSRSA